MKKIAIILYIIGGVSLTASIIGIIRGDSFFDQLLNLTIGLSLIVSAYLQQKGKFD